MPDMLNPTDPFELRVYLIFFKPCIMDARCNKYHQPKQPPNIKRSNFLLYFIRNYAKNQEAINEKCSTVHTCLLIISAFCSVFVVQKKNNNHKYKMKHPDVDSYGYEQL